VIVVLERDVATALDEEEKHGKAIEYSGWCVMTP
jgi:hypothetical protein